jgi:hypothetical protein
MRRLRDETLNPVARAMLASAAGDHAESGACDRVLGVATSAVAAAGTAAKGAAAATAAGTGGAGGAGAGGAGALSVAPTAAKGGALLLVKWTGIALLGGAAVVGSTTAAVRMATHSGRSEAPSAARSAREDPVRPTRPSVVPLPQDPAVAPAPSVAERAPVPGPASEPAPSAVVAAAVPRLREAPLSSPRSNADLSGESAVRPQPPPVPPVAAPLAADPAGPLSQQLGALNEVRGALAAGDPRRALGLLDDFERRNPSSSLREECAVLRIDALVDSGRGAEASQLADAFLLAHPASAYGQHVRSKVKSP